MKPNSGRVKDIQKRTNKQTNKEKSDIKQNTKRIKNKAPGKWNCRSEAPQGKGTKQAKGEERAKPPPKL